MAALETLRAYQLLELIGNEESGITEASTVTDLIEHCRNAKTKRCPQCATTGTIDADRDGDKDSVCPTCLGDGFTAEQYTIDLENSVLVYKLSD